MNTNGSAVNSNMGEKAQTEMSRAYLKAVGEIRGTRRERESSEGVPEEKLGLDAC